MVVAQLELAADGDLMCSRTTSALPISFATCVAILSKAGCTPASSSLQSNTGLEHSGQGLIASAEVDSLQNAHSVTSSPSYVVNKAAWKQP